MPQTAPIVCKWWPILAFDSYDGGEVRDINLHQCVCRSWSQAYSRFRTTAEIPIYNSARLAFMFALQTSPRYRISWVNLCLTSVSPVFICSWPPSNSSAKLLKLWQDQGCLPSSHSTDQWWGLWDLDLKAANWRSELFRCCTPGTAKLFSTWWTLGI